MEIWMIWIAVGILCMIIEIFTPTFLFMSFGIGAILTGMLSILIDPVPIQVLLFAIITFIVFINLRKMSKKLISESSEKTNIDALVGKMGIVTQEIPQDGKGYVKIGGEEWSAITKTNDKIETSSKVMVEKVEGNKVIVKAWKKEQ